MTTQTDKKHARRKHDLVITEPPKPDLPLIRLFKIRRVNTPQQPIASFEWLSEDGESHAHYTIPTLIEEGIEAHRFEFSSHGDLVFQRFVDVTMTQAGPAYDFRTVKIIAAGTYYDAEEVTDVFKPTSVN